MGEPLLYRIPGWLIGLGLFLAMTGVWEFFYRLGHRHRKASSREKLGPIETAVAGLLALILAFSFSMASERFDHREEVIIAEANALETTYLRCDFLPPSEEAACRDLLIRYAALRVEFYEAAHHADKVRSVNERSERLHGELWELVRRGQLAEDTPAFALTAAATNELIDLHTDRVAAQRRIVPALITWLTLFLCISWGGFAGYVCGLAEVRQHASWLGFAVLASVVVYVSIDLDRPGRGLIRPVRGHAVMVDLAKKLAAQGTTRPSQRSLPP